MKKSYLSFPARHAPKIQSRRFGLREFASAAYKSDAETAEEQRVKLLGDIKTQFEGQLKTELETRGFAAKTDLNNAISEKMRPFEGMDLEGLRAYKADKETMTTELGTLKTAMEAQGLELRAIKEAQTKALPDRKTIASQIRAAMEKDKEGWQKFKNRETNSFGTVKGDAGIELENRAAATMLVSGSTGGSAFVPNVEVMPGLVDLSRNQPFLENYANTANTSSPRIVWTEKYNPQGNAAFTAEGATKPLISFEIRTMESYAKKVADKIKVSTEMLDDIDFIAGEIESELKYKVDIAVDVSLLAGIGDGTGGATDLKGLNTYIGGYALNSITTATPNDFDALRAAAAQVVSLNFRPNIFFINPIDAANMDLTKDAQGRPLAVAYRAADGSIYRMQPVESNQVPIGYFLLGDMTKFMVKNYKPFAISYGWVNDDFEKNLVTIIGERRLHAYLAANNVGAFVYDTFANVKTALSA